MNNLNVITNSTNLTMSSREIADLVEKRHDVVKLSIERLVDSLERGGDVKACGADVLRLVSASYPT